jgi:hypothetical protein
MTMHRDKIEDLRFELQKQQNAIAETEAKIAHAQKALTDKLATAAAKKVEIANEISRLQREIDVSQAESKVSELLRIAKQMDDFGDGDGRMARALHLCGELRFLKRFNQSHEALSMNISRMRRDAGVVWKAPFPSYVAMFETLVKRVEEVA